MPTYTIEAGGRTYTLEAPDQATAVQAVTTLARQSFAGAGATAPVRREAAPQRPASGVEDVARSTAGGLVNGLIQTGNMVNDARNAGIRAGGGLIANLAPVATRDRVRQTVGDVAEAVAPSSARLARTAPGATYRPQTEAGRAGETAGLMAPGALLPGGLISRAANVALPAAGSEVAGLIAQGAHLSPELEQAARFTGGLIGGALTGVRPRPATVPGVDVTAILQRNGLRAADLPAGAQARIEALIRGGANPEAAVHRVLAETLDVPVPITRGQASGQPAEQAVENSALRGANGADASTIMRNNVEAQQGALRANVAAVSDRLAGGVAPTEDVAGAAVSDRLTALRRSAKGQVDAAYDAARAAEPETAMLARTDIPRLTNTLDAAVDTFDPVRVPSVYTEIGRLRGVTDVTAEDMFRARSRLSSLSASSDTVEALAARRAREALDGFINDAVARDLITGDPAAVARWRAAIGQRRTFGTLFEADDMVQRLTEVEPAGGGRTRLSVAPEDAARYILGRTGLGFVGRRNLARDMTSLRDRLGADSDEWNALRSAVFQRFASAGEGRAAGAGNFSGQNFANAWRSALARDPRLMQLLFTQEERAAISRLATVAHRVTSPTAGGVNTSNTATVMRILQRTQGLGLGRIPIIGQVINPILNMMGDAADTVRINSMVTNPTPRVRPPAIMPRYNLPAARGGLVTSAVGGRGLIGQPAQ